MVIIFALNPLSAGVFSRKRPAGKRGTDSRPLSNFRMDARIKTGKNGKRKLSGQFL